MTTKRLLSGTNKCVTTRFRFGARWKVKDKVCREVVKGGTMNGSRGV